jgi:hypothetical protein
MKKVKNRFFTLTENKTVTVTTIDLPTYKCQIRLKLALSTTYRKVLTKEMSFSVCTRNNPLPPPKNNLSKKQINPNAN